MGSQLAVDEPGKQGAESKVPGQVPQAHSRQIADRQRSVVANQESSTRRTLVWPSVQFDCGGGSNNASSEASGAWKRAVHSSR